jgi:uncharacterized protein involved in response to NO
MLRSSVHTEGATVLPGSGSGMTLLISAGLQSISSIVDASHLIYILLCCARELVETAYKSLFFVVVLVVAEQLPPAMPYVKKQTASNYSLRSRPVAIPSVMFY